MKRPIFLYILLSVAGIAPSCIEEYNELNSSDDERMLFVEGQIVSQSDCTFALRYSVPAGITSDFANKPLESAQVMVIGSDGAVFDGRERVPGHYTVSVGQLRPEVSYSLRVETKEGTYNSRPMLPLDATDIADLSFEQPRDDRKVDFYVSTTDPQRTVYYKWDVRETWEIYTPFQCYWTYVFDDPDQFERWIPTLQGQAVPTGKFMPLGRDYIKNHGWRSIDSHELLYANNIDYGQSAIERMCLFQRNGDDNRFQTRYLAQVRQMAITAEEYEYLHLLTTQSSEMGGLFTPMPSELPGNIARTDGSRAIGFIGVRGQVSEREIYVNRRDIDHKDTYKVTTVADSLAQEPPFMIKKGYSLVDYSPYTNTATWSYRWTIDCTDPFWGASLQRPDYWQDASL